jgi:GDP-L-fucose synthase
MFNKFLFACIALIAPCFGDEGKVLVITPSTFLSDALQFRLGIEGYSVAVESCRDIVADSGQIEQMMSEQKPDFVIVDGVGSTPLDSLLIDMHVINAAYHADVKKTIVLASSDVYPAKMALPLKESALTTNKLEWEDDPYRIAKLTALKQCHAFNGLQRPRFLFCIHPLLYGPKDSDFSAHSSHPVKSIAQRVLKCKNDLKNFVPVPNNGDAMYELLHVDDLAKAVVFLLQAPAEDEIINIGTGNEVCIDQIAVYIKSHLNFKGKLIFDPTCYDEVPRKVLDCTRLSALGFAPTISLHDGVKETVVWLEANSPKKELVESKKAVLP